MYYSVTLYLLYLICSRLRLKQLLQHVSHLLPYIYINPYSKTGTYTIKTSSSLGKLLLVKVEKDPFLVRKDDEWYCSKIVVTTPEGEVVLFPCYRWISRGELVELRGGRGLLQNTHIMIIEH